MLLALATTALVLIGLLWQLAQPRRFVVHAARHVAARLHGAQRDRHAAGEGYDPGRELRAEQRARALLRSCINEEEWAMYRDLGFLRVWGGRPAGGGPRELGGDSRELGGGPRELRGDSRELGGGPRELRGGPQELYAYLIYPHKPLIAYRPQTGVLLGEYCIAFPDDSRSYRGGRLPDADDVLAKWMALTADERSLIADANMHLPGRQIDHQQVRRDLARLARWEAERCEPPAQTFAA
jgi:hypothetical protein